MYVTPHIHAIMSSHYHTSAGDLSDLSRVEEYYFIPMHHPDSLNDTKPTTTTTTMTTTTTPLLTVDESSTTTPDLEGSHSDTSTTTTTTSASIISTSTSTGTSCAEGDGDTVGVGHKEKCCQPLSRICSLKRHRSVSDLDLDDNNRNKK